MAYPLDFNSSLTHITVYVINLRRYREQAESKCSLFYESIQSIQLFSLCFRNIFLKQNYLFSLSMWFKLMKLLHTVYRFMMQNTPIVKQFKSMVIMPFCLSHQC